MNDPWTETITAPAAGIQWKGTNVCMDFHCTCGERSHFDTGFAYAIQCPYCGAKFEMSTIVFARPLPADSTLCAMEATPGSLSKAYTKALVSDAGATVAT